MTQYTALSSRNAQLNQLDLVFSLENNACSKVRVQKMQVNNLQFKTLRVVVQHECVGSDPLMCIILSSSPKSGGQLKQSTALSS